MPTRPITPQFTQITVTIDEVDVPTRTVHAHDKTNAMIQASFREAPGATLRIPNQGELWTCQRIGFQWHLNQRLDTVEELAFTTDSMGPGDTRLSSGGTLHVIGDAINYNNQPIGATTRDVFDGNGATTTFSLDVAPVHPHTVQVYVNGLVEDPRLFSVNGRNLIFNTPPANGTVIVVYYQRSGFVYEDASTATGQGVAFSYLIPTPFKNQNATARIRTTRSTTQSAVATIIAGGRTKTQTATARFQISSSKTQTAVATISGNPQKIQHAVARISATLTKTQTAISRIQVVGSKSQTAVAFIQIRVTKTQSALARIQTSIQRTQSAQSRIQSVGLTKTQSAIAHISALAGAAIVDSFTRTIAVGSGWGDPDVGPTWTTYNSITTPKPDNFGVNGSAGTMHLNVAGAERSALVAFTHTDVDFKAKFQHTAQPVGDSVNYRLFGRASDNQNGYYAVVGVSPTNVALVNVESISGGTVGAGLATDVNIGTLTVGSWYWIRFQMVGTTLNVKVWADGSSEPATWTVTATDSTHASGSYVGVAGKADTSNTNLPTVNWDEFHAPYTSVINSKTQSAVGRVAVGETNTQGAISRISKTFTTTQTVVSRIQSQGTKTQAAVSRISTTLTKTQTATAHIASTTGGYGVDVYGVATYGT